MADTRFLLVSVATKREAVRPERLKLAPEIDPPVIVPVPALMELLLVTIPLVQVPAISMAVAPVPVLFT